MLEISALLSELRCREVINLCDGARLGYVADVRINLEKGDMISIIVPVERGVFCLLGGGEDYEIPWECIEKIGEDIIFVRFECPARPPNAQVKNFFKK